MKRQVRKKGAMGRVGRRNMGVSSWADARMEEIERLGVELRRVTEEYAARARAEKRR